MSLVLTFPPLKDSPQFSCAIDCEDDVQRDCLGQAREDPKVDCVTAALHICMLCICAELPKRGNMHGCHNAFFALDILELLGISCKYTVESICRESNISKATFHRWKRKYGDMDIADAKRLKELEKENAELKKMLAESMLENRVLKEVNSKKW